MGPVHVNAKQGSRVRSGDRGTLRQATGDIV